MVIKGNIRGNGGQLADYLTRQGENDHIHILEADGRDDADKDYLHTVLEGFSLNEKLTKSAQGLYHAQINPACDEDRAMSHADWQKAADILGLSLGFDEQRRVIVLHEKKDRIHAHVVWERFDYEQSKMKSIAHNYKAHDHARAEMERIFGQERTPQKNKNRPEMKEYLTKLWHDSKWGKEFLQQAQENGYHLAKGVKRPFMVVDESGRSFDLVRQLHGVKTKDVRERLQHLKLDGEKQVIESVRTEQRQESRHERQSDNPDSGRVKEEKSSPEEEQGKTKEQRQQAKQEFQDNGKDTSQSGQVNWVFYGQEQRKQHHSDNVNDVTADAKASARKLAHEFAESRMTDDDREAEKQELFREMMEQLSDDEKDRSQPRGRGM